MAPKRDHTDAPAPTGDDHVDPNVALFASYMKADAQKERDAKKAARQARQQADAATALVAAKDAAAAEVKRLRSRDGVSAEQRAAADDAYKAALAAVVADETGTAPTWAPPPPEAEAEAEAEEASDVGSPSDTTDAPSTDDAASDGAATDGPAPTDATP